MNETLSSSYQNKEEFVGDSADTKELKESDSSDKTFESKKHIKPGEELFYEISEFPFSHRVSPELCYLFSNVDSGPDDSGYYIPERTIATFTAIGLEYTKDAKPVRYRYNEAFRRRIHAEVLRDFLKDITKKEDAIKRFEENNEYWEPEFKELVKKDVHERLKNEHRAKRDPLTKKRDKLISRDLGYTLDNKKLDDNYRKELRKKEDAITDVEIVAAGVMTEDEVKSLHAFNAEKESFIDSFSEKMATKRKEKLLNKEPHDNDIDDKAASFGWTQKEALKEFVKRVHYREIKELRDNLDQNFERPKLIAMQMSSVFYGKNSYDINYKEKLSIIKEAIQKEFKDEDQEAALLQELDDFSKKVSHHYTELMPKYYEFANKRHYPDYEEINNLNNQITTLNSEYRKTIAEVPEQEAEEKTTAFKEKICKIYFEDLNEKPDNIYFFPTGIVARFGDRLIVGIASPLEEQVIQALPSPRVVPRWEYKWSSQRSSYDDIARRTLEKSLENAPVDVTSFGEREDALFKKYNIKKPPIFGAKNGFVYDSLQPEELELLEDVLPQIGDYIKGVEIDNGNEDISLKSIRLEALDYFSGTSDLEQSQLYNKNFCLKVRSANALYHFAGSEKDDKAFNRLAIETGIALYNSLSYQNRETFNRIIGKNADISSNEFYEAYRRRIVNPAERRRAVLRSFFVKGFIDHLQKKNNAVLNAYYDGLKKKRVLG